MTSMGWFLTMIAPITVVMHGCRSLLMTRISSMKSRRRRCVRWFSRNCSPRVILISHTCQSERSRAHVAMLLKALLISPVSCPVFLKRPIELWPKPRELRPPPDEVLLMMSVSIFESNLIDPCTSLRTESAVSDELLRLRLEFLGGVLVPMLLKSVLDPKDCDRSSPCMGLVAVGSSSSGRSRLLGMSSAISAEEGRTFLTATAVPRYMASIT
mmetsp:Transcript_21069/g.48731  ORF Transcript_21069/g.48731 Transcript_21069/m.48731 type:complete len:213 (+) Transcript_21069:1835-2473(+)